MPVYRIKPNPHRFFKTREDADKAAKEKEKEGFETKVYEVKSGEMKGMLDLEYTIPRGQRQAKVSKPKPKRTLEEYSENPKLETIGEIKAVTYHCNVDTDRGLCRADKGAYYRHEWRKSHPMLARQGAKFHVLCDVKFREGGWKDLWKTGIDDAEAKVACSITPTKANPEELDIIGTLEYVELKGGGGREFKDKVLCIDKPGKRLYIVDRGDIKHQRVRENPWVAFDAQSNPIAEIYGPISWGAMFDYAYLYTPDRRDFAKQLIEGQLIGDFPCEGCQKDSIADLKGNPIDYSSRDGLVKSLWTLRNKANVRAGKEEYPWGPVEDKLKSLPQLKCKSCSKGQEIQTNPKLPESTPDGVKIVTRAECGHCSKTTETLKSAGIAFTEIKASDIGWDGGVPVVEMVKDGKVIKSRVGAFIDEKEAKEWLK